MTFGPRTDATGTDLSADNSPIAPCGPAKCARYWVPDVAGNPAPCSFAAFSAGWYWLTNGLNELADIGDFDGVADVINKGHKTAAVGDSNGYVERLAGWRVANEVLTA